ncbi:MAG: zinc-binding alcohol dehydrogenase family protein [Kiritimatiellae bacterium]|nr:zinc-binding alcohol dehydrogenase family protein [Kiritimatiellia bacterium]
MNVFVITEPGRTQIVQRPAPAPGAEEVLLRVGTVGLCGSDLKTFRGANPLVAYPLVPGHEVGAWVERTGASVPDRIRAGLRVTLAPYSSCGRCSACRQARPNGCRDNRTLGVQRDGCLQEYVCVPWQALHASPELSVDELALVEPLTIGFHAIGRGRVAAGETVAVLGCGTVGLGAVAGAVARGATVIAVDVDADKLRLATQIGARHAVNSREQEPGPALRALTGGEGPEVVVEAVGLPQTFVAAVEAVCFAGRVVYIGYAKEPVAYETQHFVRKELDILGSRNAMPDDFRAVIACLRAGTVRAGSLISRTVPLSDAGNALADWAAAPAAFKKILVRLAEA